MDTQGSNTFGMALKGTAQGDLKAYGKYLERLNACHTNQWQSGHLVFDVDFASVIQPTKFKGSVPIV
jgi:hypothetical protein